MDELLGADFAVAEKDRLYRCLDRMLAHKEELCEYLQQSGRRCSMPLRHAAVRPDQHLLRGKRSRIPRPSTATAATAGPIAGRWSSRWWSRRMVFRWPMKCWPATPPTRRRCTVSGEDRIMYGKARRVWVMDRRPDGDAEDIRLTAYAPGLTPRAVLEKLGSIQMLDVILPTTDGRCLGDAPPHRAGTRSRAFARTPQARPAPTTSSAHQPTGK